MFIIEGEYTASLETVDSLLPGHRAWLDKYYQAGIFLFSGPKVPRTGGVIIANVNTRQELDDILKEDPLANAGIGRYTFIQFQPNKAHPDLTKFLR